MLHQARCSQKGLFHWCTNNMAFQGLKMVSQVYIGEVLRFLLWLIWNGEYDTISLSVSHENWWMVYTPSSKMLSKEVCIIDIFFKKIAVQDFQMFHPMLVFSWYSSLTKQWPIKALGDTARPRCLLFTSYKASLALSFGLARIFGCSYLVWFKNSGWYRPYTHCTLIEIPFYKLSLVPWILAEYVTVLWILTCDYSCR